VGFQNGAQAADLWIRLRPWPEDWQHRKLVTVRMLYLMFVRAAEGEGVTEVLVAEDVELPDLDVGRRQPGRVRQPSRRGRPRRHGSGSDRLECKDPATPGKSPAGPGSSSPPSPSSVSPAPSPPTTASAGNPRSPGKLSPGRVRRDFARLATLAGRTAPSASSPRLEQTPVRPSRSTSPGTGFTGNRSPADSSTSITSLRNCPQGTSNRISGPRTPPRQRSRPSGTGWTPSPAAGTGTPARPRNSTCGTPVPGPAPLIVATMTPTGSASASGMPAVRSSIEQPRMSGGGPD